jgi:hypothetical protein
MSPLAHEKIQFRFDPARGRPAVGKRLHHGQGLLHHHGVGGEPHQRAEAEHIAP